MKLSVPLIFTFIFVLATQTNQAQNHQDGIAISNEHKKFSLQHSNNIKKIEPSSWWVGMKNKKLQIMIHGDSIGHSTAKTKYAGIKILQSKTLDNPNYLFIEIEIAQHTREGLVPFKLLKNNKEIAQFTYQIQNRESNSANRPSFSSKDSVYLLMPDRFANGNPLNDNHPDMLESVNRQELSGRHGGDIVGLTKQLSYISQLGFTMIWSTPLIENNQEKYSYHGYAATDFYSIDPRFGTNEDYKKLVHAAKKQGIGFIHDVVLNHIGSNHWWMKDKPSADWINYPHQYIETNHVRTSIQDPNSAKSDREKFVNGWFVQDMPDLNQKNKYLSQYLIQNTIWWIEYAGLAGLRVDTYPYSDKDFLTNWSKIILDEYPKLNIVGEEMSMNPAVVAYWQKGKLNQDGYQSYLPSMLDFPVYESLYKSLVDTETSKADINHLYLTLANDFQYASPKDLMIFEGNHDAPRIFSLLDERIELNKLAMVLLATLRGVPHMFYGTEILMTSPKLRDDGKIRGDFPGGWEGDKINAFTGVNLEKEKAENQEFVKKLFNWRKKESAIHYGTMTHYSPENNCYVYFRIHEKRKIMVIINAQNKNYELKLSRFHEHLKNIQFASEVLSNKQIDLSLGITLEKQSAMILDLSEK